MVKAIAFKSGMTNSAVQSATYYRNKCGGGSPAPRPPATQQHSVSYTFDNAGNRTQVIDSGDTTTYAPNQLNQYDSVGTDGLNNGNFHEIKSYQGITYGYINDAHLDKVTDPSGNSYTLAYDALGRCVKRKFKTQTTFYYYDGEKPIIESGADTANNIYGLGIDEIVIGDEPANTYYFYHDHEGSVTHVRANYGLAEEYRYDAFGAPTILSSTSQPLNSSTINNRFMFTGREYQDTFGFYEYRARAYHPGLGRFMSEDPKGFDAGDYNLFRYCHNDPVDHTDATGTDHDIWTRTIERMQAYERAKEMFGAGAIELGLLNRQIGLMQQARDQAQKMSEGRESRSPQQHVLLQSGRPGYRPGLVPVNEEQIAYGKVGAERMAQLTQGSMEANAAIIYNADTHQYAYTGYVKSHPTVGGGQEALTPALPPAIGLMRDKYTHTMIIGR